MPAPTNWACLMDIPVPTRRNAAGDIECMGPNERDCSWQASMADCNNLIKTPVSPLKPLVCGAMHKAVHGDTGYDNPAHWCARTRVALAK
jgi:hypothetical protein